MPKAIVVSQNGGPEVLELRNIAKPKPPAAGQVLLRHTAIGVNYMDIYYRSGFYKSPRLPMIPGMEAVGIVEAVGKGVKIPVGSRVVYATAQTGAYCQYRLIKAKHLSGIPDSVSDNVAAAIFAKAMTAHYLLLRTYKLRKGDTILIHAAAGGVGQIMCQLAKHLGAIVIGTVGSDDKISVARMAGCDHVINYTTQDFAKEVMRITKNQGVLVAYDSVGKDTFQKSISCIMPLGLMVSFGQSSGPVPDINVLSLAKKGIYLTRPTLSLYKGNRHEFVLSAVEVFKLIEDGVLRVNIHKTYPLEQAAKAHSEIESRLTTGSTILTLQ